MKNIILTGDSGDLGKSIRDYLLENDYYVIGISRRDVSDVDHKNYKHISFDLEDVKKIRILYLDHLKKYGGIFGMVNNAAYAYDDIVTNANPDELDRLFKINIISPIILSKYVIRDMLLNDIKGSLVNISSVSAHTGYKGLSMYAATKGALESFSKNVAREWGERGIRSNCIAPGFMETNMTSSSSGDQKNRIYKRTALKKQTDIIQSRQLPNFYLAIRPVPLPVQQFLLIPEQFSP